MSKRPANDNPVSRFWQVNRWLLSLTLSLLSLWGVMGMLHPASPEHSSQVSTTMGLVRLPQVGHSERESAASERKKKNGAERTTEKTLTQRNGEGPAATDRQQGANGAPEPDTARQAEAPRSTATAGATTLPVVTEKELDRGFRQIRQVYPRYPPRAFSRKQGGEVRVELEINARGEVSQVRILKETGQWGFGEAVSMAFLDARFTPPTMQGRPVRVLWRKTLRFAP